MGRIFEIAGWIIAATIGLALWMLLPEARTILACLLTATLVYRVFVAAVRLTALRIVGDQLTEIRAEVGAIARDALTYSRTGRMRSSHGLGRAECSYETLKSAFD